MRERRGSKSKEQAKQWPSFISSSYYRPLFASHISLCLTNAIATSSVDKAAPQQRSNTGGSKHMTTAKFVKYH
jgi:hypothetical protein